MSMGSQLHHLFNPATCQSSIHTLRWKDRPLQCPRCQSHNVGPWGAYHYQPGLKRYRCKEQDCKRTCNDLTGTLLDGSKRSVMHWILATFLLCLSCSSRRIAREVGVHMRTSYRWCWWLRNAALSYEMEWPLEGTVEADDLYHTAGHKGQAKPSRAGKSHWAARHEVGARNASPGAAMTTRIGLPSSRGSAAREES
jgi:transposase-like protein